MAEMIVSQKIIVYNNLVFSERVYVKPSPANKCQ